LLRALAEKNITDEAMSMTKKLLRQCIWVFTMIILAMALFLLFLMKIVEI